MTFRRGDKVKIMNKDGIEGEIVGFYAHTMDVLVKTRAGHQWIVSPAHLEEVADKEKKK